MNIPLNKSLPIWQLFIYLLVIGLTFIVTPESSLGLFIIRAIQLIELLFCTTLLIKQINPKITLDKYNLLINIWWLTYILTAYQDAATNIGLTPFFSWMNVIILLLMGTFYWKKSMTSTLRFLSIIFSLLIYLNAILLVLYPDGLWVDEEWVGRGDSTRYLFGNYNQSGFVCLLGITTQAMYSYTTSKGYSNLIILMIVSIVSVLFVGSMTSTVCLCLLVISFLFCNILKRYSKVCMMVFCSLYLIFFIFIIWKGVSIEEFTFATEFIENTLSKDSTFSNRTRIWNNAVNLIQDNLWSGYGKQELEWNDIHLGGSGTHNLLLMLLLQGGIVLCLFFVGIIFYVIKFAIKTSSTSSFIALESLCIMLIMSLFETYHIEQIFLLIQVTYYSRYLINDASLLISHDNSTQNIDITLQQNNVTWEQQ